MSVLESVLNNKFSLRYYGLNDVATSLHATSLLQKDQLIIEYFSVSSLLIKSEEDFRDYLTLITITKYQEVVGSLKKESDKRKLQALIDFANVILSRYAKPLDQIYDLINDNYQKLLEKDKDDYNRHKFVEIILDYIFSQHDRVIREVFSLIEQKNWGYILHHFDKCINYYKQHTEALDMLMSSIYQHEKDHPYSNIESFLTEYKMNVFFDIFKKYAVVLSNKALSLLKTINEDNYIEIYAYCENMNKLARRYDLKKQLNEFDKLKLSIEKASRDYLKKHGKEFKQEIPINEIIDKLREELISQNNATNITFLGLTHTKSKTIIGYDAIINSVFELPKSPLTDSIRHIGLETNSRFPASVQSNIRLIFGLYDHLFAVIVNDNDISLAFFEVLSKVLEMISNKYHLDYEDLNQELNGIIDAIVYLYSINDEYPYYHTYCFGLCQTICSYIEKLLRKLFIEKYDREVLYIPESQITLGKLLEYEPIVNLLGVNLASILTYELHQIVDSENGVAKIIGMNLRNKLMHNNSIDFTKDIHTGLVVHLFHILVIIIHQLETTVIKFID